MSEKTITHQTAITQSNPVGDGFVVRNIFSYGADATQNSPFLHLDYGAPTQIAPSDKQRGVGEHPHKGFETVTLVYQGELAHRDSSGGAGVIGPGDVQWMTAGSGLVHEELYSDAFSRSGGTLEFFQLWVNLPAADKTAAPGYQTLLSDDIPVVLINGGTVRVIAGELGGVRGPARTFTPLSVLDARLDAGSTATLPLPEGHTTLLYVRNGNLQAGDTPLSAGTFVRLSPSGDTLTLTAATDAQFLLLTGDPIDEPIAAYGPFVMNTAEEIHTALYDFRAGKMGRL